MFKGKVAQAKKVRVAAVLYPNYLFWLVWAKSDVTSYQQLKGKRGQRHAQVGSRFRR